MKVDEELERMLTIAEVINLLDIKEMGLADQLTMIQAYIEFMNKLEPLVKKYGKSPEHVMELKEKRDKENAVNLANIINKLAGGNDV